MKWRYEHTVKACFGGYIVQAVVNNFVPLLFLTFQAQYGIPLSQITLLITLNFILQLIVDFASAFFVDKIGYRVSVLLAHGFAAAGFLALPVLPQLFENPFTGLLLSVMIYAVGGGLLEVLISPIVEACPTEHKEKTMSMLHSFYCWGSVGVILLSTLFFTVFGTRNWKLLSLLWALLPAANGLLFRKVPIAPLIAEGESGLTPAQLLKTPAFWLFLLLIICSGASEQAVSQWASTFAEQGLGVEKAVGDLAGPMLFSVLMGSARFIYGKFGDKINLNRMMLGSGCLCIASYLLISLAASPVLCFAGVAVCGFSVGILWPGTFSKASGTIKGGGTVMFALLALGGDLGCSGGPTFVGMIADAFGEDLKKGILAAVCFPVLFVLSVLVMKGSERKAKNAAGAGTERKSKS